MLVYPATIKPDTNGTLLVTFPDVPEAATHGDTKDEALSRAVDALESALEMYVDDGQPLPVASHPRRGQHLVYLEPLVDLKFQLYGHTLANGIRKAELARRLGWHLPEIDRLFDIRHASRMDKIAAAFAAVGKRINFEIEDAA